MICHTMFFYFCRAILSIVFAIPFACTLYTCIRHAKFLISGSKHEFLLITGMLGYIIFSLVIVLGSMFLSINYVFKGFTFSTKGDITATATLTVGAITALSLLGTLFGVLYTSSQNRIQTIHSESSWRKMALELEQQTSYKIGDLVKLNSLFNPYKERANDDYFPVDFYINKVIVKILDKHNVKRLELNEFADMRVNIINSINECKEKDLQKIQKGKESIPDMYKNSLTDKFEAQAKEKSTEELTLFNYRINKGNINDELNPEENQIVRKCIHGLLKYDWDNIMK